MSDGAPRFPYRRSPDQGAARPAQHPVIVVGAGPVGLDEDDTVSTGSRSICWAKRTLEIYDRLGCAERMMARGITWNRGKVFHGDRLLYEFDLLPEHGHRFPAFINLQQNLAEEIFVRRAQELTADGLDLRWKSRVTDVAAEHD